MLRIGQRVVLVRDFDPGVRAQAPIDGINLPIKGEVYTVRALHSDYGYPIVLLVEVVNPLRFYGDIFDFTEQGFDPDRFRPVVERKTDISIFKAMLNPSKQPVEA